jgi:hypothetical protein
MQQVDKDGKLMYYFYVVVEFGTENKYSKTYVIGQGKYKQPRRAKYYKTMHRMLNTWDNKVVSCGYTCDADDACLHPYTHPSHDFIADLTTT